MILQAPHLLTAPKRIVSLVPSLTELLFELGLDDKVVGITKFCVHPANRPSSKKIIGGTKNINLERVKNLLPCLIIANKEENLKEQVEALAKYYPVWVTDVQDLKGALQMIQDIGSLTHTVNKAKTTIKNIGEGFTELQVPQQAIPSAYLIWRNPLMTVGAGTFINDMLNYCGLQNIFDHTTRYPEITVDDLRKSGCRLLLLSSEPYPFKQKHSDELQLLLPGIKIILADGRFFSWYGSRLLFAPAYFQKLMTQINSV